MKELFHFSLFERKGIISLLCMALVLLLVPRWWSRYRVPDQPIEVNILTVAAASPDALPSVGPAATVQSREPLGKPGIIKKAKRQPIFINQASVEEWTRLRGIGDVLSRRIVTFRDKMGGFTHVDQVGQTYGLADSVFQQIRPRLRLEKTHRRWRVNSLGVEELAEHPYISLRQAKAVVSYRQKSGPFSSSEAFQQLRIFSDKEHQRLAPYLDFARKNKEDQDKSLKTER